MARSGGGGGARDYVSHEEATALARAHFQDQQLRVVDWRVEAFASEQLGYLADHKLLSLAVQPRDDELAPRRHCSFFAKALAAGCDAYERSFFREEVRFFGEALPRLLDGFEAERWAPECYLAKGELLVLEDLRAQSFAHAAVSAMTAG
ncbi:uncharacterized protein LOC131672425 [Phymastichus coffea]|uniref:uncharacterized protein LOC131672425 n=1 Tax=Phymastichus coffea TaxID=108790 RepID=UPI00273B55F5|nr:uncharacterized protein LOC131672425 [Phymastichus coffea]